MKKSLFICLLVLLVAVPANAAKAKAKPKANAVSAGLRAQCSTQRALSRAEIYKSRQSPHIPSFDRRKNSTALIYLRSARPAPGGCLNVLDSQGKIVHRMGIYARGESLYSARFYGGSGCGDGMTPSQIASVATKRTKKATVYIDIGSQCLIIPDPRRCFNSVGC
jgi:hypothetical protein